MKSKLIPIFALALLSLPWTPSVYAKASKPAPKIEATAPAPTLAAPVAAQPWLYKGSDVPVDTSWTFGELPNGLRYAVKKNDVPAGQVSIRVRIDAGALHEEDDELGFAHLIEHLSFRGSTHVPDGEAKRIWQRFGVTFGSDSNAQTTATQTVYKLDLPNAAGAALDESMKILSGMMRDPRITPTALEAERAIVLAELRENSGAQMQFGDALRSHFFQGQRLAKRGTIGTPDTLKAATAVKLDAFQKRWYRPENAVVVIAGDSDPALLEGLVKKYFADWRGVGPLTPEPDFGTPKKESKKAAVLVEATLPLTANIGYVRPWRKVDDTIAYNEQLLIDALATQIINRRLEVAARSGGNFLFAEVNQEDVSRSADTTLISITPAGEKWEQAVKDVRGVIADAIAQAPSKADIEREKALFAGALRTMLDSYPFEAAAKQADDIVQAVDIRETVAAPKTVVQVFDAMQDKFTPERLLASTQALFSGIDFRLLLSSPKAIPDADKRLMAALAAPVSANGGSRLAEEALSFDALPALGTPGKVVLRVPNNRFGMERIDFANGSRAMLYPNKAESGQIRMLVRFGKGMQAVAPKDSALLWTGQLVLGENGIGTLKRTQIDQMVNGRRIELTFGVENDAFRFSSTTRTQDMADQLKLIATKLEYPGWDSAPVERGKAVVKSGYGSFEMSASSVLQRDLEYLLTNGDLRWKTPLPADVDKVTAAQVQKFWQPLLASGPIEIMLFGDFETDQAIAALANSFGAMKPRSAATVPAGADTLRFPAALQKPIALTHKGPADQAAAVIAWPTAGGKARISESRELELLAAIFRDRLFEKFRAEQAASYSPDMANNWPEEFDSGGYLMAYSQVRPEDVPRFFAFADAVAKDLVSTPVSDDELKRAVEPIKQNIERASSGNTFWLNQLKGASFDPGKFASLSHLYTDFASVTPARLQQLAKTYFDNSKAWKLTVTPAVKTVAAKK